MIPEPDCLQSNVLYDIFFFICEFYTIDEMFFVFYCKVCLQCNV